MPKIQVGDVNLNYDVAGKGEPLLLIMGLGASSAQWDPELITELARTFRTITFDNRGTGQSDKPDAPYSIEMFADDAAGVLDEARRSARAHLRRLDGRDDRAGVRAAASEANGDAHARMHHRGRHAFGAAAARVVENSDRAARGRFARRGDSPRMAAGAYAEIHRRASRRARSGDSAAAQVSDAAVCVPAPARSDLHAEDLRPPAANQGADPGRHRRGGRADPGEELRDNRVADTRREIAHHPRRGTRVHVRRPRRSS